MNKQAIRQGGKILSQPTKQSTTPIAESMRAANPRGIPSVSIGAAEESVPLMGGNTRLSPKSLKGRALKEGRPANLNAKRDFCSGSNCNRE